MIVKVHLNGVQDILGILQTMAESALNLSFITYLHEKG